MNSQIIIALIAGAIGGLFGYVLRKTYAVQQKESWEARVNQQLSEAKTQSKELLLTAKDEAFKIKEEAKKEEEKRVKYLQEQEQKLSRKEDQIESRSKDLDKEIDELKKNREQLIEAKEQIGQLKKAAEEKLQTVAGISREDAIKQVLEFAERENKEDLTRQLFVYEKQLKDQSQKLATKVLSTAIQRIASETSSELTVSSVSIPSEDMKGRIIGREGRNVQAFEKATGVDVMIDDTPDAVVLSCFDPVRRAIAKLALERLIADGRIHPARIEEMTEKAKKDIGNEIKEAGEQAVYEVGVAGLHEDLIKILGRLKFRTSYGQNQLRHSIEVSYISAVLASEVGADVAISKKAGLLHDLGKALTHEVPGAHHHISMDLARKYGLSEHIVNAIGAHHDDIEPTSVEALVVKAADAISGGRPGARRESSEVFLKRMKELEAAASSFPGIEKVYVIQAGREVRVFVKPTEIDDLAANKLAKAVAEKIEKELTYPGQIKVNIIRETRITEYAR